MSKKYQNTNENYTPKLAICLVIIGIIGDIIVALVSTYIPYYQQKKDNENKKKIITEINNCSITYEFIAGISYVKYYLISQPNGTSYRVKVWPFIQICSEENIIKTIILENQFTQNEYISDGNECYLRRENNIEELISSIQANDKMNENNYQIFTDVILAVKYMHADDTAEIEYYLISNGGLLKKKYEYAITIINEGNYVVDMKYWPINKEKILDEILKDIE